MLFLPARGRKQERPWKRRRFGSGGGYDPIPGMPVPTAAVAMAKLQSMTTSVWGGTDSCTVPSWRLRPRGPQNPLFTLYDFVTPASPGPLLALCRF